MIQRAGRYERMIKRFVTRYKMTDAIFRCDNGANVFVAYCSRPTFLEDSDSVRRVVSGYEWIVTKQTFNYLNNLAGDEGLFDSSIRIEANGEIYRLDRQTPFQSLGLEAGYRLITYKVKESESESE